MRQRWLVIFMVLAAIAGIGAISAAAQDVADKSLFLIAKRDLSDPLFAETVVVMLPSKEAGLVVGLIVNKSTRVPLREVFPKNPALKDRPDKVYFGGPVDLDLPAVLFLSSKPIEQAIHLEGELYISFDLDFIEAALVKPEEQVRDLRLFLGRAQWSPAQLEGEIMRGSWYSEREEITWIFKRDPEKVWPALIGRLEAGTPI